MTNFSITFPRSLIVVVDYKISNGKLDYRSSFFLYLLFGHFYMLPFSGLLVVDLMIMLGPGCDLRTITA